jgi:hypothetical protein
MNAEELAAIREWLAERYVPSPTDGRSFALSDEQWAIHFGTRLLAHIDALTTKVEGLPQNECWHSIVIGIDRAAVLAILRGEA